MRFAPPLLFAALVALFGSRSIASGDDEDRAATKPAPPLPACAPHAKHSLELGLVGGAGFAHRIWGGRADRSMVLAGGRFGYVLTDPIGPGPLRGNLQIAFEALPAFIVLQEESAYGVSGTLLFRHLLRPGSRFMPVVSWGAGVLYTSDETPPGTTRLNFTPQIGLGLSFLQNDHLAVGVEYRLHHISNANLAKPNPGINSSVLEFGVSVFRRRRVKSPSGSPPTP